jgi:hypothetical protein
MEDIHTQERQNGDTISMFFLSKKNNLKVKLILQSEKVDT